MSHRSEIVLGPITSAFVLIGLAFAIFGPATYSYGTNWLNAASVSLWDQRLDAGVIIYLVVMLVAGLAVTVGAYLRQAPASDTTGAVILWAAAIALLIGAAITLPGNDTAVIPSALHTGSPDSVAIGIYLVPAVLMAFVTATVSMVIHHTPGRPVSLSPR